MSSTEADPRILDALYGGASDEAAFRAALGMIADKFRCRSGTLFSVDARAPATDLVVTNGVFDEYGKLYVEQFAAIDPAPSLFARLRIGTVTTTDRLLTREQREACIFLQEFFRPIGFLETLGGHLFSDGARFSLIGLQRGREREEYSDGDIAALQRLMPHIGRALQLRRTLLRIGAKALGLQAAVDRAEAGMLALDGDGAALFVNRAMEHIAQCRDGLTLDRGGRLLPLNLQSRRRLEALVADVFAGGAGGIVAVPRPSGALSYAVLVAPLPLRSVEDLGVHVARPGILLIVHDPAARTQAPPEILQKSLGLPPGAARLVAALAADDDLKSFAARERVTIHTARYHLRTALARTETRTQADLVRVAVRLLRDFGLRQG